jgi:hypothetical protein
VAVVRWGRPAPPTWRDAIGLATAGALTFLAVAIPMSVTRLRFETGRTWVLSSLGATLLLMAVAAMAGRATRKAWVAHGLAALFIALGTAGVLAQHGLYSARSELLRTTLGAIVDEAPGLQPETLVALVYERGIGDRPPGISIRSGVLTHVLRFIYDEPSLLGCIAAPPTWPVQDATCRLGRHQVVAHIKADGSERSFAYSRVVAVRYLAGGGASVIQRLEPRAAPEARAAYRPAQRIRTSGEAPTRAEHLGIVPAR